MEWVETTAKTVAEAKDAALDQLGVDESDAEFHVVDEPKPGLFGRVRGEARVRARVAPRQPRPKQERRERRGRASQQGGAAGLTPQAQPAEASPGRAAQPGDRPRRPDAAAQGRGLANADNGRRARTGDGRQSDTKGSSMDELVTVDAQALIMQEFLEGMVAAFALAAEVTRSQIDDDTIELNLQGGDLGLLIGPKGQTLAAVQDLSRTVLQRRATGAYEGRVRIDVSGYRQRRREALARFVHSVADQVQASGQAKALEPMNAADRKVVHDTINERDGVRTLSEGEEPRRRVVIEPDT